MCRPIIRDGISLSQHVSAASIALFRTITYSISWSSSGIRGTFLRHLASFIQCLNLLVSDPITSSWFSQFMMWLFHLQWSNIANFKFSCSFFLVFFQGFCKGALVKLKTFEDLVNTTKLKFETFSQHIYTKFYNTGYFPKVTLHVTI